MAAVCPMIGASTNVLPPNHPAYDPADKDARCPVTNATVSHHGTFHEHSSADKIEGDVSTVMDAQNCPAVKSKANESGSVAQSVCPVVGAVADVLPPTHPSIKDLDDNKTCPVTNATMEHHQNKVHEHPSVPAHPDAKECPVASGLLKA